MATGQQIDSIPVNHPVLGPAISVYDDHRQALGILFLYVAFFLLGILGAVIGKSDLGGGIPALGWAEVAGGIFLSLYSVRAAFIATRRLGQPIALVVGKNGFEYALGNGPVRWDEVATVGDPAVPLNQLRMLKVHLADPQDYVRRHALSPIAGIELRVHRNDLHLGNGARLSVAAVQALMNERLTEFRRAANGERQKPPARALRQPRPLRQPGAPKKPRPSP